MDNKLFNDITNKIMSLFTGNVNSTYYGREIARKLKLNHRTVLLYLNLLEKERILISKKRGKLKEFSINKSNLLSKDLLLTAELYKAYSLLSKNFEINQIVSDLRLSTDSPFLVFGSFAKGYSTKDSDLDILVISKENPDRDFKIREKYTKEVNIMTLTEEKFLEGIKNKEKFILEILESHILCQGFEKFIGWWYNNGST